MYGVILKYMGENRNNEILQEIKFFSNLNEALESLKIYYAEFLVGYGVLWENINEEEHREEMLTKSLNELKEIAKEAYFNKELDYIFELVSVKQNGENGLKFHLIEKSYDLEKWCVWEKENIKIKI
ncbi:hypothetical protein ACLI44_001534 [Campylobacter upsaliensis]|uniref:Uncharacterized protein n=1 Tax=Campylobacter upsaliensis TaxID=28080 RepID=A0A7U8G974_CAMUP|nr:hypothetical protein [Campylobacter upsaliensis]EAH5546921.1 hypothetical protein [Campylobacter upsaliensis]EAH6260998.1 hypothetical protein [Campylobacter upsaliensis]EAJ0879846.1 hypothetical protein [Campylobacter upsaliensis]EAJ1622615.1 hypothetical protein [Campylobacter upsaliensis]EAJ4502741.1 hypothetical protein [Campylobacter upsaliensis]